jgi:hypothetical protein
MILIISGLLDNAGLLWKNSFPKRSAFIITPADFSRKLIAIYPNDIAKSYIQNGKTIVPLNKITGILALTQSFFSEEFIQFNEDSKEFAASEVNALLSYVLHTIPCKKINSPSFLSFNGPAWRYERWYRLALETGIPCLPLKTKNGSISINPSKTAKIYEVKCLNNKVLNTVPIILKRYALKLQNEMKLNYCAISFIETTKSKYYFSDINVIPNVKDQIVKEKVVNYLVYG